MKDDGQFDGGQPLSANQENFVPSTPRKRPYVWLRMKKYLHRRENIRSQKKKKKKKKQLYKRSAKIQFSISEKGTGFLE
jgi:hypothetical protein